MTINCDQQQQELVIISQTPITVTGIVLVALLWFFGLST